MCETWLVCLKYHGASYYEVPVESKVVNSKIWQNLHILEIPDTGVWFPVLFC